MYKNVVTGKNEKFKFPSIHTIKHSLFNYTRFCQFLKTRAHVQAKIATIHSCGNRLENFVKTLKQTRVNFARHIFNPIWAEGRLLGPRPQTF